METKSSGNACGHNDSRLNADNLGGISVGKPEETVRPIHVTFEGNGGTWEEYTWVKATSSNATPSDATPSDADWWYATPSDSDEEEENGTWEAKRVSKITKTLSDAYGNWDYDDNYYVTFDSGILDEEDHTAVTMPYDVSKEEDPDAEFAGWYYRNGKAFARVSGYTPIYNDVTLTAGWTYEDQVKSGTDAIDETGVTVTGLSKDATLTFKNSSMTTEEIEEALSKTNVVLTEENAYVAVDIELNGSLNEKQAVITMDIPDGIDGDDIIKIIHKKKDGSLELIEPDVNYGEMTFAVDSFSPFIIANAKNMYTVKVENVADGYLAVYTYDNYGETYLPVGEEVVLPEGTELYYDAYAYGEEMRQDEKTYDIDSIVLNYNDGSTKDVTDHGYFNVDGDMTITADFKEYKPNPDYTPHPNREYWLRLRPNYMEDEGDYTGKAMVMVYDESKEQYVELEDTELELLDDYFSYNNVADKFQFDPETNTLKSVEPLETGTYRLAFLVNQEDVQVASIYVGRDVYLALGLMSDNGNYMGVYSDEGSVHYDSVMIKPTDRWNAVEAELEEIYENRMILGLYNYVQDGWETYNHKKYESDSQLAYAAKDNDYEYGAYMRMVNIQTGELYKGAPIKFDYDPETPDTPNVPVRPSYGSSDHDSSDSYSISSSDGKWIMTERGWWFSYTAGGYPKNEWKQLYWNGKLNWYFFDAEGWLKTGWLDWNGKRYYLHPVSDGTCGYMYTGWHQIDGKWYYFGADGALVTGTVTPDGYVVDENGVWQQ